MTEARTGRQTMLLVATEGGPPAQLAVGETPEAIIKVIASTARERYVQFVQPLGAAGMVFVRLGAIIAFWDQQVEMVVDPRAFGVQQTASGLHLPPKAN